MVDSITKEQLREGIAKSKMYFEKRLAPKTFGYYASVWDKLMQFSGDSNNNSVDVGAFYRLITCEEPFNRPKTHWKKTQARALFSLLDLIEGNEPQREYYYKTDVYTGPFVKELQDYLDFRSVEEGKKPATIRAERLYVTHFLRFVEANGIEDLNNVTVDNVLNYLNGLNPNHSDSYKRGHAYTLRRFLKCPRLDLHFSYEPDDLLLGFRRSRQQRLESFYSAEEIKAVMAAIDRDTPWGKTIYAMMLLACIYGLRIGDIRELRLSSIHWDERKITLYQKKTLRYVKLPLTDEVQFALLDYLKNVRPDVDCDYVFLRHTRPYIPYSPKDNFGSKVSHFFRIAGIDTTGKHHGFHSLRHSLATNLLSSNTSINEISSIMGHSSIKSTKPYIWSDIQHLKACALEVDYD